ncbi:MAG: gamma-glutamyltransferase family protein, partial [Longimicrobiales bacterium]|nr:gamma-glutamyltransferase family protein [Longimicrobiales bacterium]
LRIYPTTEETFLPGGEVPAVGDTFEQPELAETLRRIRDQGATGFYSGRTADLIVEEMERGGGLITHEDLEQYEAVWRDPVRFQYHDHGVISMAPPSSGGATMAEGALIMEEFYFSERDWHSATHVHLMAEAWKRAYIDRNTYLADPTFVEVPLDAMIAPGYADERRDPIVDNRATPADSVLPGLGPAPEPLPPYESVQTTHFSIVDSAGRAVSVTTTLNSGFGNKVTVAGAGFVLNNEMDDFSAKPGAPNLYGLVEGEANVVQPGKRMLSSMSPTIVEDPQGNLLMVTGTPGGSTIISTTFQTISNVVDFGMNAAQSVRAPRVHHQHLPDQIYVEPQGLPADVMESLRGMGHTVVERDSFSGDAQVILVREDGILEGASDPRRGGTAAGF